MAIIELRDIGFHHQDSRFIEGLTLSIDNQEFIGLVGPNGSGKTTMLKIAAGFIKPLCGEVLLWGKALRSYRGRDRAKLISYLPQSLELSMPVRVREIVEMGLSPYDIMPEITAEAAMEMVGINDKADYLYSSLSGGEKRRVFMAMTIMQSAGLLLLDEPLANLDIKYQLEIMNMLKGFNVSRQMTVVMAIHDISMAFYFDRILLVSGGAIVADGRPEAVLTDDNIRKVFGVELKISFGADGRPGICYP